MFFTPPLPPPFGNHESTGTARTKAAYVFVFECGLRSIQPRYSDAISLEKTTSQNIIASSKEQRSNAQIRRSTLRRLSLIGKIPSMDTLLRQLQEARGYLELGLFDAASAALENIHPQEKTRIEVLALRADLYIAIAHWPLLHVVSSRLVQLQPDNPAWWLSLGRSSRHTISLQAAHNILRHALSLHHNNASLWFLLGCYACQLGRLSEAKSAVALAIQLDHSFKLHALDAPDLLPLWTIQ